MAKKLVESRLEFSFEDEWNVVKWDDEPLYRASGGFGSLEGTAAVDFVGVHPAVRVVMFELKNFTLFHHDNVEKIGDDAWHQSLAGKVRDTLAGVVWSRGRTHDMGAVGKLLSAVVEEWASQPKGLRVVLWIEDRPVLKPQVASALESGVRRHLKKWLNLGNVSVLSTASPREALPPGLSVRALP